VRMAVAPSPGLSDGAIAQSAATVAFLAFITFLLAAAAVVFGGITVENAVDGLALTEHGAKLAILAIGCLGAALGFGLLATVFG